MVRTRPVRVLRCATEHCIQEGREWKITPDQNFDGLISWPRLFCRYCGCEPIVVDQVHEISSPA